MKVSNIVDYQTPHALHAQLLNKELVNALNNGASRKDFMQTLSGFVRQICNFDRLCIYLYDSDSKLLSFFTSAEGVEVRSIAPIRKLDKATVAWHVITSKKPVVITDLPLYFSESGLPPITEAGLTTTMVLPLILDKVIGTLHCSFIQKPDNLEEITEFLLELYPYVAVGLGALLAMEQMEHSSYLHPLRVADEDSSEIFFSESSTMQRFLEETRVVAKMDIPVMLIGETGVGKSAIAHYMHRNSQRSKMRFVKVNCPALAPSLFESELFGHAKGAFTGASGMRIGRFELAHRGTILLDEIAELSQDMQSKLLHVLEDNSFERVGESTSLSIDTRVIAATNIQINSALREGTLRSDFYHRLSSCVLEIPPLRERVEDIPILANYFSSHFSKQYRMKPIRLSSKILEKLTEYHWPGNVRELRNVINTLLVRKNISGKLTNKDIDKTLFLKSNRQKEELSYEPISVGNGKFTTLEDLERLHIIRALEHSQGVISGPNGAARVLGISRSSLQRRMVKLNIRNHTNRH